MKLSARDKQIFTAVMQHYCNGNGSPVASTKVAKQDDMQVCSATVRNAMARLETHGLLFSPHTSAGRVPTGHGLKYWLEEFFPLSNMATQWQPDHEHLVAMAHHISQTYQVCCCVGLPQVSQQLMFRVEVLDFDRKHWLVLLLDRDGQSHNIRINKPEQNSDALRYQFAAWMNTVFSQQTLVEGLHRMRAMAHSAPPTCHQLLAQWTRELSFQLGNDNAIVVGERFLYNKLELEEAIPLGAALLNQIESLSINETGISILLGQDIQILGHERVVVLSIPYFTQQQYQNRFCIVCPADANMQKILAEFNNIT